MDLSPDEDNFPGRLLHQAALWDNVELLRELILAGEVVSARDAHGRTALHAAVLVEDSQCLEALLRAGIEVDAASDADTGGKTALHIAVEHGHTHNISRLVEAGASITSADAQGRSAVTLADSAGGAAQKVITAARDALERDRLSKHTHIRELVTRGEAHQLKTALQSLGAEAGLIVNLTPAGANTLLYLSSEAGTTAVVAQLLDCGADGRAHPVTKYCPLYIACYRGHLQTANLLLKHFPQAAQQETVEKWLPIHAACIGGHPELVKLLLDFSYPEDMMTTYSDKSGQWRYTAAFDVNALDARNQSALYIACTLGNVALVEALLSHTVVAEKELKENQTDDQKESKAVTKQVTSPHRTGISMGIHAIVSKLTGLSSHQEPAEPNRFRPVNVSLARGGDSCVACATRGGHVAIVKLLLTAGAEADAPACPPSALHTNLEQERESRRRPRSVSQPGRMSSSPSPGRAYYNSDRDGPWSALALAARAKNTQIVELLISHGATDERCIALRECAKHGMEAMLAKLLHTKAYPDPDFKINKSTVSEKVFNSRAGDSALTYSSLCPTTPVMINWRELNCQLATVRMKWLRGASLHVNSKLGCAGAALHAITRVDISNNELKTLPPDLFTMLSLRYLNAAQNKLECLPTPSDEFDEDAEETLTKGRRVKRVKRIRPAVYSAPVLADLYLQDNRLEEIPPSLFSLRALNTLDLSNNKLHALPSALWAAPQLKHLNVAFNHLRELPRPQECETDGISCSAQALSPSESSPQLSASSSTGKMSPFIFDSESKSSSRSPSIERSMSEVAGDDEDAEIIAIGNRAGHAVCTAARRAHTWRSTQRSPPTVQGARAPRSPLLSLRISHNQLASVPRALACAAPSLHTLHMQYNQLRSMSYVTSYPASLRHLDLSHNQITCWPSLPQIDNLGPSEDDPLACYCGSAPAQSAPPRARPRSGGSARSQLLHAACPARRHLRLDLCRTLILANNMLTRIQLTTDDDGYASEAVQEESATDDDEEWGTGSSLKGKLLFPQLSMLDVSCNLLRAIPPAIHALSNLAVLNISGNKDITDLPPQMGLLSRLWNLNTAGCNLVEPLRSMVSCGQYRSMHIVSYLKCVLQEARPYKAIKLMFVGKQGIGKTSLLECLRQESAIQHRRKQTEHWSKRMGNKSSRRGNMSTVGVDIGAWLYEKHRSSKGPVTFRTWDFGGQQEYYATHQYFLSRRSLYLVVWKVTDGKRGLADAIEWLRSIQARAPGSPVIMVATYYDQVPNSNLPENESPEALQRLIRTSIMAAPDADKLGLPKVLDSLEVSCSTRHNIRLLADIAYSAAFTIKPPGSKEPLLEQRVPATFLALEECVSHLASELKEPVLTHSEYKRLVTQYMQQRNHRPFRDATELHQATMFLHENGVLLHYDDATLKELYFLRPQWLCDVLAHVVTVREINPFASNGIMKIEDLAHVFKASPQLARGEEASSLGMSLLNKFELALCWAANYLLVPALLPAKEPSAPQLPLRPRSWSMSNRGGTPRRVWPQAAPLRSHERTESPGLINESPSNIVITARDSGLCYRRVLSLSYTPCGLFPRLSTRLLGDEAAAECRSAVYSQPDELDLDEATSRALELNWGWKLWKSGLKLVAGDLTLISITCLPPRCEELLGSEMMSDDEEEHPYQGITFRLFQEGVWCDLDPQSAACIEILLPAQVCVARREDGLPISGYQSISVEPNLQILAKLLALVSDHIDLLLEDWYPSLGTRFVHTSEGRCLITRIVPCPLCMREPSAQPQAHSSQRLAQAFKRLDLGGNEVVRRARVSEESRHSDGDSGVGAESNASSRLGSVEGALSPGIEPATRSVHAWTVEQCIAAACGAYEIVCSRHEGVANLRPQPDTLLLDVEESKRARWDQIQLGAVIGRGAFGTVHCARYGGQRVALKALQPIAPQLQNKQAYSAYKAALSRWERDPFTAACRAYCGLRQELSILSALKHAHVVQLLAVCASPLALLLELAPRGALDSILREYRGCGARVGVRCARALLLQVARALEYLHSKRIVYRDLKSENVLVWSMPKPQEASASEASDDPIDVHVKLGDYGISRMAPPSGTKGFGGTEGFMAPEIMRYNGEEEYNEKVDCFSYGMLIYEIITLRQPFEGHEAVKEAVLDGARPSLTTKDLQYPSCILETMRRCWLPSSEYRPSGAALVSLACAAEFLALQDAAQAATSHVAMATRAQQDDGAPCWEILYGGEPERVHSLVATQTAFTQHYTLRIAPDNEPVSVKAMCRVGSKVWLGDTVGRISVYSAATCAFLWSVRIQDAVGGAPGGVAALHPVPHLHRACVALTCGRLFLVSTDRPEAEGSFVLTELGTATELCCLDVVLTSDGFEMWAGGSGLYHYSIRAGCVSGAESLTPRARILAASAKHVLYCLAGCVVYQISVANNEQIAKLDCSKLVPCSESLQSIAIDEHLSEEKCQVTALSLLNSELYVGTAWGCIIVAEAESLRPITVFRPYEENVTAIIPLHPLRNGEGGAMLATLGTGYRPLLQRYAPQQPNATNSYTGPYCLLWRAQHWLPD